MIAPLTPGKSSTKEEAADITKNHTHNHTKNTDNHWVDMVSADYLPDMQQYMIHISAGVDSIQLSWK